MRRVKMGPHLYVGNIPFSVTEEKLKELFSRHGSVGSARIITDKLTGRSKGFGFVEMGAGAEAERATVALNGIKFEGRSIVVSEARAEPSRASRGRGEG